MSMNQAVQFALNIKLPSGETKILVAPWGHQAEVLKALPNGAKVFAVGVGEFEGTWEPGQDLPAARPDKERAFLADPHGDCRPIELHPLKAFMIERPTCRSLILVHKAFTTIEDCPYPVTAVAGGCLHQAKTIGAYNHDSRCLQIGATGRRAIQAPN